MKYGPLKHKWLKENGTETRQIERHVAALNYQLWGAVSARQDQYMNHPMNGNNSRISNSKYSLMQ
jgi:hypothetical protein